jgi:hypothetical protein
MEISASVRSAIGSQTTSAATNGLEKMVAIPAWDNAPGPNVNGADCCLLK